MRRTFFGVSGIATLVVAGVISTTWNPSASARQSEVRMHLTRMLSLEETVGLKGFIHKTQYERPYLTCTGDAVELTLFAGMYEGGRMVLSKTGGRLGCGGRQGTVTADVLVPVGMALSRELRSESRAAAEFIPGDQFLPRLSFSAVEYQRGSIGPQIARELRLDLSERPWYVVAAISSSGGRDVRSTPWVVVHR